MCPARQGLLFILLLGILQWVWCFDLRGTPAILQHFVALPGRTNPNWMFLCSFPLSLWFCSLFPGLDEIKLSESHVLYKVIHRTLSSDLQSYHLLVTARPCPAIDWLFALNLIRRHIVLSGFTKVSRDKFFDSYGKLLYSDSDWSGCMQQKLKTLLKHINSHGIGEMTYLPFFSTLLVYALPKTIISELPKTKTLLLCYLLMSLLKRDSSPSTCRSACPIFNLLSKTQLMALRRLASFAFQMTVDRQLIFDSASLVRAISSGSTTDVEKSEFKLVCDCLTFSFPSFRIVQEVTVENRQFIHLSIHELLTAYHLLLLLLSKEKLSCDATSFEDSLSEIISSTTFGSRFTEVLPFLASLTPVEYAVRFFRCLVDHVDFRKHSLTRIRGIVCSCFHEWCLSFDSIAASEEDLAIKKHVAIGLMRSLGEIARFSADFTNFTELERLTKKSASYLINLITCAPDVFKSQTLPLWCKTSNEARVLSTVLRYQTKCEHLSISYEKRKWKLLDGNATQQTFQEEYYADLCKYISQSTCLKTVYLVKIDDDSLDTGTVGSLTDALSENSTISSLHLSFSGTVPRDSNIRLISALDSMINLRRLYIDTNVLDNVLPTLLQLKCVTRLTHISFHCSTIDQAALDLLCSVIRHIKNLTSLAIWPRNEPERVAIADIAWEIRRHPTLQLFCINLNGFHLTKSDVLDFLRILVCRKSLRGAIAETPLRELEVRFTSHDIASEARRVLEDELHEDDECMISFANSGVPTLRTTKMLKQEPTRRWHEQEEEDFREQPFHMVRLMYAHSLSFHLHSNVCVMLLQYDNEDVLSMLHKV